MLYRIAATARRDRGYERGHHPHRRPYVPPHQPPRSPRGTTVTLWTTALSARAAYVTRLVNRRRAHERPPWFACVASALEHPSQQLGQLARVRRHRVGPAQLSAGNGPVATATARTPSARAQAMSRGVSPTTTVRSRG